jgi:hypothetical protein
MRPAIIALSLMVCAAPVVAQQHGMHGGGMHGGGMMGAHHGADGTGHDEVNMPGLRGLDATPEESAEMQVMFMHFTEIDRTVETLPNGIRTTTTSANPYVREALISHVAGMTNRVAELRDPQVFIQSPTLDIFFLRGEEIETNLEVTETGIIVTQTAEDPELIAALQTHAAEVTDMAERGMQPVHERMMQQAANQ